MTVVVVVFVVKNAAILIVVVIRRRCGVWCCHIFIAQNVMRDRFAIAGS